MQTITAEQFKQKYGDSGINAFKAIPQISGDLKNRISDFSKKALPIGGMVAGGIGGGIIGGPVGAITGASLGGGAGEAISEKLQGQNLQPEKIIESGLTGGVSELTGMGIMKGIKGVGSAIKPVLSFAGKELKPLIDIAKAGLIGIKKVLPGISDESAQTILKNASKVEALASQKTLPVNYIVDNVQSAANTFEKNLGADYEKQWLKLLNQGNKFSYNKADSINSINSFLTKESDKGNVYFKLGKSGKLDFTASPFTKSQQQNVIKAMVDEINTAQPKNIAEIRALKQRLNAIYQEYSSQFGKNPQLNRVVTNMVNAVDEALPKELRTISKQYSEGLNFLNKVDELLLPTSKATGELKGTTVSRIKTISKEEIKNLYGDFLDEFKKKTGYDLANELDIYNAAREINPNLIPQDTGGITRGIQRAANPFIGMIKIKQAQGLIPNTNSIIDKLQGFQPVIDFMKDTAIPITIKTEIFSTLQDFLNQK